MSNALQILKDFAEGNLSCPDFEKQLAENTSLEALLNDASLNWQDSYFADALPHLYLIQQDFNSCGGKLNVHGAVQFF